MAGEISLAGETSLGKHLTVFLLQCRIVDRIFLAATGRR
jgi:hypothetical protein